MELGAELSARDMWEKTPRTVAEEGGKMAAAAYLASVGAPTGGEAPPGSSKKDIRDAS